MTTEQIISDLYNNAIPAIVEQGRKIQAAIDAMSAFTAAANSQSNILGEFFSATPKDVTLPDGRIAPNIEKWKTTQLKGDAFTFADFTPAQLAALKADNRSIQLWGGTVKNGAVTLSTSLTAYRLVVVELSLDASTTTSRAETRKTVVALISSLGDGLEQPLMTTV